jgi:hypothetical protein
MPLTADDVKRPEPRINELLGTLQQWEFESANDIEFRGQDVYLDGREFTGCSFYNCNIYITLGYFRMINPKIIADCKFYLAGPAEIMKTLIDIINQGAQKPDEGATA